MLDLSQFDGHTPGEWQQNGREIVGAEGTPRGRTIALLALNTTSGGPPFNYLDSKVSEKDRNTVTANGRLLSAAPALLAEVRALRAEVETLRGKAAETYSPGFGPPLTGPHTGVTT